MPTAKLFNFGIPTGKDHRGQDDTFLWLYIEDHLDGKSSSEHFMHSRGITENNRYQLWQGGGGFGHAGSEKEAAKKIFDYAAESLDRDIRLMSLKLAIMISSRSALENPECLERFLVPEDWSPAKANGKQSY